MTQTIDDILDQFYRGNRNPVIFSDSTNNPVAVLIKPEAFAQKFEDPRTYLEPQQRKRETRGQRKLRARKRELKAKRDAQWQKQRNRERNAAEYRRKHARFRHSPTVTIPTAQTYLKTRRTSVP